MSHCELTNVTQSAMACCNNKGTRMLQTCNGAT